MVFVEPIDDGIFKCEGVTVKCPCGEYMTIPEAKESGVITCPSCGRKI